MLRNLGVTGLVASLMGAFVLALQSLSPVSQQPPEMSTAVTEGQPRNPNGVAASSGPMVAQSPATGQGQPQVATASAPMAAQPGGMQTQQMPMMGMCGGMMKMMMGGQMNQGGRTNQPGGTIQQSPTPQTQPQGTGTTQTTAQVVRR